MRPYPLGIGDHSQRKERRHTALEKEEELQKLFCFIVPGNCLLYLGHIDLDNGSDAVSARKVDRIHIIA